MNRIQALAKLLGLAAFACSTLAFGSTAKAELEICNWGQTQAIWYSHIISDAGCGPAGKRHEGWAVISPNQCRVVFNGSMNGKTLQAYAILNDGSREWKGPVQQSRLTPRTNFSGCLTAIVGLCTNPGAPACTQRQYTTPFTYQSASVTIAYNPI
jgi:uncharacterized membrane protein